jgi:hypothetical protein
MTYVLPYLAALQPGVLDDDALADFLQGWIVGLTGLDPTLVRPKWQAEPLEIPQGGVTWMEFGIKGRARDFDAYVTHVGALPATDDPPFAGQDAYDMVFRTEGLDVDCVIYGPNSDLVTTLLSAGTKIEQNLWPLASQGIRYISIGDPTAVPEKIKQKWVRRNDIRVNLRRAVSLRYPVQDLESVAVTITVGDFQEEITVDGGPGFGNDLGGDFGN